MEMLIKIDPRLHRAYLLKEGLRLCFRYTHDEAVKELDKWLSWAQRSRIPEFVELGRKIKRHKPAIHNSFKYRLTNARIEAINNKIKVTIRMGYGFRNIDNLRGIGVYGGSFRPGRWKFCPEHFNFTSAIKLSIFLKP